MANWTTFLRKLADESPLTQAFGLREAAAELERLMGEVERLRSEKPKPWRIEIDWFVEVLSADDTCVAKFQTRREAEAFIAAHLGEGS